RRRTALVMRRAELDFPPKGEKPQPLGNRVSGRRGSAMDSSTVRPRPNYYEALGLTPAASEQEIAQAFARHRGMFQARPVAAAARAGRAGGRRDTRRAAKADADTAALAASRCAGHPRGRYRRAPCGLSRRARALARSRRWSDRLAASGAGGGGGGPGRWPDRR